LKRQNKQLLIFEKPALQAGFFISSLEISEINLKNYLPLIDNYKSKYLEKAGRNTG
jgi:hypothetical protein